MAPCQRWRFPQFWWMAPLYQIVPGPTRRSAPPKKNHFSSSGHFGGCLNLSGSFAGTLTQALLIWACVKLFAPLRFAPTKFASFGSALLRFAPLRSSGSNSGSPNNSHFLCATRISRSFSSGTFSPFQRVSSKQLFSIAVLLPGLVAQASCFSMNAPITRLNSSVFAI
jgi:hypothetical protein